MSGDISILIPVLLPLFAAVVINILGRVASDNVRDGFHTLMAIVTFYFVCQIYPEVTAGGRPEFFVADIFPGASLSFKVEPLGMLFGLVASGLWIVTSVYAFGYMRGHDEQNQTRFFTCFASAIGFAIGVAFSSNLLTLFAFYECLTFSTYPLVTHYQDDAAKRAGRIYMGILVSTSVCLLLAGVIGVWYYTGTMDFVQGGILRGKVDNTTLAILLALFAFGTGKAALLPFHKWLPNAMVAPTPVSALLHAVAVVKAGVFTIMKVVVYVFGIDLLAETGASEWLMAVAAVTILFTSCVALTKDNLKARLAYSTISQLSYIVLGAAMANAAGAMGGSMHIVMHAMGKITLFFCAGAIFVGAHLKNISDMDGLAKRMPWTLGAFTIASFSIIGLPPLGGVWGKWFLGLGALETGHTIYLVTLLISSLLSIGYLMPVVGRAYFRPAPAHGGHGGHHGHDDHGHDDHHGEGGEAPLMCVVPLCITAVGCILLFIFPEPIQDLLAPIFQGAVK